MFTGLIQALGTVTDVDGSDDGAKLRIATKLAGERGASIGDSIAVDGVCVTALDINEDGFAAELSPETLRLTTLGNLGAGSSVNLESALTLADPLGGHLVSGHVDGLARLAADEDRGDYVAYTFQLESENEEDLRKYLARKGSVAVNGVSLTVNQVAEDTFDVMLIPHTLAATNLGGLVPSDRVNIEVDLLARYAARIMTVS